jgi:uncharacterized protein (TIGR00369 family)
VNETAEKWEAERRAVEARMAAPGVSEVADVRTLSGIEFFNGIASGRFPSVAMGHVMGFAPIEVEIGRIVFQGTPGVEHLNPMGSVHGGYVATLLDSALGCAVHSTLPAGRAFTTLELKVNMIRALTPRTGPVRAEGKVVHVGRQTGVAEGRVIDSAGRLLAWGSTTCLIFDLPQ